MTQQHPITPPQWQIDAWQARIETMGADVPLILLEVIQWGRDQANADIERERQEAADQELEACIEVIADHGWFANPVHRMAELRAARRPKPPSLAETATYELDEAVMRGDCITTTDAMPHLRAALKRLAELENQPQS
jgi:hypothetical protein